MEPTETLLDSRARRVERAPKFDDLIRTLLPTSGRLSLGDLIGSGGMGSVTAAREQGLERTVALKQLADEHRENPTLVASLIREARVTARLEHPCVVPIYEIGVREYDHVYYTMKRIEGDTLSSVVRRSALAERTRAELLDLVDAIIRICGAVAAAHDIGYVHCDIKPQNIMLGRFGAVYLMDWGGAQPFGKAREEARRSREAAVLGGKRIVVRTPAFMAPEQAVRAKVTPATDIFLLGGVLYYVATGCAPYSGAGSVENMRSRAKAGSFQPPSVRDPSIEPALEAIILRAMAFDPEDRYPSAQALADALKAYSRGSGWEFPIRTYEAGEVIIQEGEVAETAYVIIDGSCEVSRVGDDGGEQRLRVMDAGEVFGETAIFAGVRRTATVRALEPTKVGVITRDLFERDVARWNPWMARFVETLAKRLAAD